MTRGLFNRQNIDVWLNDYLKMFTLAKQAEIVEVIDSKCAYRDFLHAIEKTAFIFVEVYEFQLKVVMDHEVQLIVIIDTFRHHMRMKEARKERGTIFNSAFAVDKNKKTDGRSLLFRGQKQKKFFCICGKKQ